MGFGENVDSWKPLEMFWASVDAQMFCPVFLNMQGSENFLFCWNSWLKHDCFLLLLSRDFFHDLVFY